MYFINFKNIFFSLKHFNGKFKQMNTGERMMSVIENGMRVNASYVNDYLTKMALDSDMLNSLGDYIIDKYGLPIKKSLTLAKKMALIKTAIAKSALVTSTKTFVTNWIGTWFLTATSFCAGYTPLLISMLISRKINSMIFSTKCDINMEHYYFVERIEKNQKLLKNTQSKFDSYSNDEKEIVYNHLLKKNLVAPIQKDNIFGYHTVVANYQDDI